MKKPVNILLAIAILFIFSISSSSLRADCGSSGECPGEQWCMNGECSDDKWDGDILDCPDDGDNCVQGGEGGGS